MENKEEYKKMYRSPLKARFNELINKYDALCRVVMETQPTLYNVYNTFLEDLESLEDICNSRGRY